MNTASSAQRPGGAIGEVEVEKRRVGHAAWTLDLFQVPEVEGKKRFHDFDLPAEIMHAVADKNFQYCTPIQEMSLEHALAGKNVAGKAQTGTGKTAAFLVAILTRYLRTPEGRADKGGRPRALVIAPTRELVIQICKDADELGKYWDSVRWPSMVAWTMNARSVKSRMRRWICWWPRPDVCWTLSGHA